MKTITSFSKLNYSLHFPKLLASLIFLICINLEAQNAHLKLVVEESSNDLATVHLMIKSSSTNSFILGDQNIRLYYNAEALEVKGDLTVNRLSHESYEDFELMEEVLFNNDEDSRSFNSTGFLNYNISLKNQSIGGSVITGVWRKMMSITFKIIDDLDEDDLVIASSVTTKDIATAYMEVTEWINNTSTIPMNLTIEKTEFTELSPASYKSNLDLMIGPNPTVDYVYVTAQEQLNKLTLYSINGAKIMSVSLDSNEGILDMSQLLSGSYILEIEEKSGNIFVRELVKA